MIWRLVRESNPRLPTRQAGTLAAELTRQANGFEGWCRVRDSNPRPQIERVVSSAV